MGKIKESQLAQIKSLYYTKKLSMGDTAKKLGVSIDAVCYFMRKHRLKRRTGNENSAITFGRKPLSYRIKNPLSASERELKIIGVLLYWTEGYKTTKSKTVDFANADPRAVSVFVKFLRQICGVDDRRLRVLLYCYANQNIGDLVDFWCKLTKIPKSQFTKPYVRKDFRKEKEGRMKYGMVHIRYSDKKLLSQIMQWIEEVKLKHCVGTQVVNEDTL